jgi:hypothetical protein
LVIAVDTATDDDDDDDDVDEEVVKEDNDDEWIFREEGRRMKAVAHPSSPGKANSNDANSATKTMRIMAV